MLLLSCNRWLLAKRLNKITSSVFSLLSFSTSFLRSTAPLRTDDASLWTFRNLSDKSSKSRWTRTSRSARCSRILASVPRQSSSERWTRRRYKLVSVISNVAVSDPGPEPFVRTGRNLGFEDDSSLLKKRKNGLAEQQFLFTGFLMSIFGSERDGLLFGSSFSKIYNAISYSFHQIVSLQFWLPTNLSEKKFIILDGARVTSSAKTRQLDEFNRHLQAISADKSQQHQKKFQKCRESNPWAAWWEARMQSLRNAAPKSDENLCHKTNRTSDSNF